MILFFNIFDRKTFFLPNINTTIASILSFTANSSQNNQKNVITNSCDLLYRMCF